MKLLKFSYVAILSIFSASIALGYDCELIATDATFMKSDRHIQEVALLEVACNSDYKISLNAGRWFSGTRQLRNQNYLTLLYTLWADAQGSVEWGDIGFGGTYAANPVTWTTDGNHNHKIFGNITQVGPQLPTGLYSDSVDVILSWPPYGDKNRKEYILNLSFLAKEQCTLDVSGVHGFGTWPAGADDLAGVALGHVNLTCSFGVQFAIGIDAGLHYNGQQRHLFDNGNRIAYRLRTEPNGNEWGDSGLATLLSDYVETHPGGIVQGDGNGQTQHFFVWGDASVASAPAGRYTDEVSFTVVW